MKTSPAFPATLTNAANHVALNLYECPFSVPVSIVELNVCTVSAAEQFARYKYMFSQNLPEPPKRPFKINVR